MKISGIIWMLVVACLASWTQSATAWQIAICPVGPIADNEWIATMEEEKKAELGVHIDYIHRVCALSDKQLTKLKIAAKQVTKRIVDCAEEQQNMINDPGFDGGMEPAILPLPIEEDMMQEEDMSEDLEEEDFDDMDEPSTMELPVGRVAFPGNVMDEMSDDEYQYTDEDFMYGLPVTNHPLWKSTISNLLDESQQEKLDAADQARFEQTYASVIAHTSANFANRLFLNAEQTKQFSDLIYPKMQDSVREQLAQSGQVYDLDHYIYTTITSEDVADILTEAQSKRWELLIGQWQ